MGTYVRAQKEAMEKWRTKVTFGPKEESTATWAAEMAKSLSAEQLAALARLAAEQKPVTEAPAQAPVNVIPFPKEVA